MRHASGLELSQSLPSCLVPMEITLKYVSGNTYGHLSETCLFSCHTNLLEAWHRPRLTGGHWAAGQLNMGPRQLREPRELQRIYVAREGRLLGQLAQRMQGAGHEGTFDVWMKRESDLVQVT